jgi:hypothetical protein
MNKIRAVKAFRDATGCGLHAAITCVEGFLNGPSIVTKLTLDEFRDLCATWGSVPDSESLTQDPELPLSVAPAIPLGDWVRRVQRIRRAIAELGERHLVTMRASDFGGRLLTAGLTLAKVEAMCVWKGLPPETIGKIKHHAGIIDP